MNPDNIKKIIRKGNLKFNEPMSRHTTFRTGGPAKLFVEPYTETELAALLKYCSVNQLRHTVIGNGSNLLVSDKGYDGIIIHLGRVDGSDFVMLGYEDLGDEFLFDAGCGCIMSVLGSIAEKLCCTGFEPLSGIPGCIGGAVIMNAGAYGTEIGQLVQSVRTINSSGDIREFDSSNLEFRYRGSSLSDNGLIVSRVNFCLPKGSSEQISFLMKDYAARRKEKQPLDYPSAGSTFKRPQGYFAGKLIEDCGLKNRSVGDAIVSEKHAGFIINKGNASSMDIYSLIRQVKETVKDRTGIELEPEVKLLGDFDNE